MVWGWFWDKNCGTFCPLSVKSVNKGVYVKLPEYLHLPVLRCVYNTLGDSLFQQDNTSVQKTAVVVNFSGKYNFQVDDWPHYSPDINPIKHVLVELKHRLHGKYPDTGYTTGWPNQEKAKVAWSPGRDLIGHPGGMLWETVDKYAWQCGYRNWCWGMVYKVLSM